MVFGEADKPHQHRTTQFLMASVISTAELRVLTFSGQRAACCVNMKGGNFVHAYNLRCV